jgi:hypothetical protein
VNTGPRLARYIGAAIALGLGVVLGTGPAKPDLQGNWTNATQTPLERLWADASELTEDTAAAIEQYARDQSGARTWREPGLSVLRIDGAPRSSIIIDPPNGRFPPLTDAAKRRVAARAARRQQFGEFDHPELRPLSERCLVSFGSNTGPPMLPNYAVNNNYTIVQTNDHVMIMSEMIHDARIIPIGATTHAPSRIRPWFGDSIGRWEGATLVVETINIHPTQLAQTNARWAYRGASEDLKVTERLTLIAPDVIRYRFTMEDPAAFTAPVTGELLFTRMSEMLYGYACHEGNSSMAFMLSAERAKEARAH